MATDKATASIVSACVAGCAEGGALRTFLVTEAAAQGRMRSRFAEVVDALAANETEFHDTGVELLTYLNATYKTRHVVGGLPPIYESFVKVYNTERWFFGTPPYLSDCTDRGLSDVARLYVSMLRKSMTGRGKRPFSLMSRWLHLCFPRTFVTYDTQSAHSLLVWSNLANRDVSATDPLRMQFDVNNTYWAANWDDPRWYVGLLTFYRGALLAAVEIGVMDELAAAADEIQTILRDAPESDKARLTVLDLLELHMWQAGGDKDKLGI